MTPDVVKQFSLFRQNLFVGLYTNSSVYSLLSLLSNPNDGYCSKNKILFIEEKLYYSSLAKIHILILIRFSGYDCYSIALTNIVVSFLSHKKNILK